MRGDGNGGQDRCQAHTYLRESPRVPSRAEATSKLVRGETGKERAICKASAGKAPCQNALLLEWRFSSGLPSKTRNHKRRDVLGSFYPPLRVEPHSWPICKVPQSRT